jgi:DNA-binding beta-propeller fold protein YncE
MRRSSDMPRAARTNGPLPWILAVVALACAATLGTLAVRRVWEERPPVRPVAPPVHGDADPAAGATQTPHATPAKEQPAAAPSPAGPPVALKGGLPFGGQHQLPKDIAFTVDGSLLLTGGGLERDALVWDVATGEEMAPIPLTGEDEIGNDATALALSPTDPNLLAVGLLQGGVRFFDVDTGRLNRTLKGHRQPVERLAFTADGKTLFSLEEDKTVRRWDVASGTEQRAIQVGEKSNRLPFLACSPDGKLLALNGGIPDNVVRRFDATTGGRLPDWVGENQHWVNDLAFSPDGKLLVVALNRAGESGKNLAWIDAQTGKELGTPREEADTTDAIAFSPDGTTLACVMRSGTNYSVRFWDVATRTERYRVSPGADPSIGFGPSFSNGHRIAFSADGSKLAIALGDKSTRIWEVAPALGRPVTVARPPFDRPVATPAEREQARKELTGYNIEPDKGSAYLRGPTLAALPHLRPFPKLAHLGLGEKSTDEHLALAAKLPQVRDLILTSGEVTDKGLRQLQPLRRLSRLVVVAGVVPEPNLAAIGELKQLRILRLSANGLTDAGLKHLSNLTDLTDLVFVWDENAPKEWKVTAAGLGHLSALKKLQLLDLGGLPVTDDGLASLAGLSEMRSLVLWACPVTDAGLKSLAGMRQMESLDLRETKVTGSGFGSLKDMKELKELDIKSLPGVVGPGLEHLAGLPNLRFLDLSGTGIGDAGLPRLSVFNHLSSLKLPKGISASAVEELKKSLKNVEVTVSDK